MNLEQRIQQLEHLEAIRQLKHRYLNSCDLKDIEAVRQCFAEGEILIDYGVIGTFSHRDSFIRVFEQMACHAHVIDLHHGTNPEIEVNGDQASGRWALYFFTIDGRTGASQQLGGFYQDRYRLIEGQWFIVETKFLPHSVKHMPAPVEQQQELFE
ncbi:bile acid 7-alpha dehydratase [Endozoicomonas montiporae]|uniref:Bile acid 7-alpha dehydratase n=2 Tax=Endozoicomonas montiporae TaxID=1027273 RepID=A0A081N844_9GAMM|nr:bile acid 7-alpha dehydratase [Endozoicomonas montiporae]